MNYLNSIGNLLAHRNDLKTEIHDRRLRYVAGQWMTAFYDEKPPLAPGAGKWVAWAHVTYIDSDHRLVSVALAKMADNVEVLEMHGEEYGGGSWVVHEVTRCGWYGPIERDQEPQWWTMPEEIELMFKEVG